jgi:hypothetical protein
MNRFLGFSFAFCSFLVLGLPALAQAQATPSQFWLSDSKRLTQETFIRLFPEYIPTESTHCSSADHTSAASMMYFRKRTSDDVVSLRLTTDQSIRVYADTNGLVPTIILSEGFLESLADEAELAFALAHEMGHVIGGHRSIDTESLLLSQRQQLRIAQIKRRWELEADLFAIHTTRSAGYQDAAADILQRFAHQPSPIPLELSGHPQLSERLNALEQMSGFDTKSTKANIPHQY